MKSIAIIPARGGSKRIPRKNIKDFFGKPIIAYSIEAAINSGLFDEIMVSTDDDEIAGISKKLGAKIPFMRSENNSNDYATTVDVLLEVLEFYKKQKIEFDYFFCIYPTAPFVTSGKLQMAFNMLKSSDADGVLPVTLYSYPIQRALKIENNFVRMFWPENYNSRTQDLIASYHDSGQFYCMKTEVLYEQKRLFTSRTLPFGIPESEMQDIDCEEDWKVAESKYKLFREYK